MGVPLRIGTLDASGKCIDTQYGGVVAIGTSTPSNGTPGYAPGSTFINTTTKTALRNNGTKASCTFVAEGGATITADTINELTTNHGTSVNGTVFKTDSIVLDPACSLSTDIIHESTTDNGILVDNLTIKDGGINGGGTIVMGVGAERATIKGIYTSGSVAVAVPSIANDAAENVDSVTVDISALTFAAAVGDAVIANPLEALPTDCLLCGAYVSGTDTITLTFGSKEGGGGVTGANKNFSFLIFDLT